MGYGAGFGALSETDATAYLVLILLPKRPENARVTIVSSGLDLPIASAHTPAIPASGHLKKPVPISTAEAPNKRAAAIPRASATPPEATTGRLTASLIAGTSENSPIIFVSASPALKAPLCPPASMPCATITSAPASSAKTASLTVVAFANHLIFFAFREATKSLGYKPMIDDTTPGPASRNASHCSLKFTRGVSAAPAGMGGPHFSRN